MKLIVEDKRKYIKSITAIKDKCGCVMIYTTLNDKYATHPYTGSGVETSSCKFIELMWVDEKELDKAKDGEQAMWAISKAKFIAESNEDDEILGRVGYNLINKDQYNLVLPCGCFTKTEVLCSYSG